MKLNKYLVTWEVEVEACDPNQAAEMAREIQLDTSGDATAFEVAELDFNNEPKESTEVEVSIPAEDFIA